MSLLLVCVHAYLSNRFFKAVCAVDKGTFFNVIELATVTVVSRLHYLHEMCVCHVALPQLMCYGSYPLGQHIVNFLVLNDNIMLKVKNYFPAT